MTPHKPQVSWHFFRALRCLRHLPLGWNFVWHLKVPFMSVHEGLFPVDSVELHLVWSFPAEMQGRQTFRGPSYLIQTSEAGVLRVKPLSKAWHPHASA